MTGATASQRANRLRPPTTSYRNRSTSEGVGPGNPGRKADQALRFQGYLILIDGLPDPDRAGQGPGRPAVPEPGVPGQAYQARRTRPGVPGQAYQAGWQHRQRPPGRRERDEPWLAGLVRLARATVRALPAATPGAGPTRDVPARPARPERTRSAPRPPSPASGSRGRLWPATRRAPWRRPGRDRRSAAGHRSRGRPPGPARSDPTASTHLLGPGDQQRAVPDQSVTSRGQAGGDRPGQRHHDAAQCAGVGGGALRAAAQTGLHHERAGRPGRR